MIYETASIRFQIIYVHGDMVFSSMPMPPESGMLPFFLCRQGEKIFHKLFTPDYTDNPSDTDDMPAGDKTPLGQPVVCSRAAYVQLSCELFQGKEFLSVLVHGRPLPEIPFGPASFYHKAEEITWRDDPLPADLYASELHLELGFLIILLFHNHGKHRQPVEGLDHLAFTDLEVTAGPPEIRNFDPEGLPLEVLVPV